MEIICFFAGMAFFYVKSAYSICFLAIVLLFRPRLIFVICFLIAIVWGTIHDHIVECQFMPNIKVIQHTFVEGYVASLPIKTSTKTQFQFHAVQMDAQKINTLLLLSCYKNCPDFHAGDSWRLGVKLQRPKNLNNPGGFDYVSWLRARHIHWTGYIQRGQSQFISIDKARYPLLVLRQNMANILSNMIGVEKALNGDRRILGILEALTLGITTHIEKDTWDLFRRTGTTHLMVISGAHIGLVAGLTYGFFKWFWCRLSWFSLRVPAQKVASIASFFMAAIYALLAGFGIPAQRALIVCFLMLLHYFSSHRISVWQAWRYALLTVLVFEPHSVMMPGFYLSFLAVAILVLVNQRAISGGLGKTMIMQLSCLIGLMPLTLFWFSYGAVNGFFANLLAIPWVSFVIVPLGLLTTLLGHWLIFPWSDVVLTYSIHYLLGYLDWINSFDFLNLTLTLNNFLTPLSWMVVLTILIFLPVPRFLPALFMAGIAAFFPAYEKINQGDVGIDVLDVGQGLSIVIRTRQHALVYDTGLKFYQGGDMGQLAVVPYLKTLGLTELDKVIISHPDLDHRGGLASLEKQIKVKALIVDNPSFYKRGLSCHQHPDWTWNGVSFHFFSNSSAMNSKNNSSCVLQISTDAGRILLTGDIEKQAEAYLTQKYAHELASSLMIVPHHGSKTSSTDSFVEHVAPDYAIVSYGFDNRYHFPHQQAMATYQHHHIPVYNTMDCGMVSVLLRQGVKNVKPICFLYR